MVISWLIGSLINNIGNYQSRLQRLLNYYRVVVATVVVSGVVVSGVVVSGAVVSGAVVSGAVVSGAKVFRAAVVVGSAGITDGPGASHTKLATVSQVMPESPRLLREAHSLPPPGAG